MKLRHQILILLGLPMSCQLLTVGLLSASFTRVDEVARRETSAKRIVSLCQVTNGLLGQLVMEMAAPSFFGTTENKELLRTIPMLLRTRVEQIRTLVKDNPQALALANRFGKNSGRYVENLLDIVHGYNPQSNKFFFSQFLEDHEYIESMKVLLDTMVKDLDTLLNMYGQEAEEFQPAAIQARTDLRHLIIAAVAFNLIMVAALAVIVNKNTLSRLQILMENMQRFSRGQQGYERLSGTDELAELDKAFKDMSDERNRLDEIRKSLQAMVSHDLRSPLASINLSVELVLSMYVDTLQPNVVKILGRMHSQLLRLSRLARTLLDVEKIEDGHLEVIMKPHSCAELIDASLAAVVSLAEHTQITFKQDFDPELNLICDEDRTIQVIVNFLSNAIKFAPPNSTITVSVKIIESFVHFEIIDEGPGVPDEQAGRLFEKFRQLDQPSEVKKQGSGLGLFICKMLISAQGGQVGYKRADTGGSCFWFDIPITTAEPPATT